MRREYASMGYDAGKRLAERLRWPMLIGYFGCWLSGAAFLLCLAVFGEP